MDERLVQPETREQLLRGRRLVALPANPPHGDRHFRLDYALGATLSVAPRPDSLTVNGARNLYFG
jgi:hypothetical protein